MRNIRERLTYGNVVATLALCLALGGTSYAVTALPRNSVGSAQIRPGAVSTSDLRNGTVAVRDLSRRARSGLAHRSLVHSGGGQVRGNATDVDHAPGSGVYLVAFDRDVSRCVATATLSDAQNGPTAETPPPGRVTLGTQDSRVLVRTFGLTGAAQDLPFSLLVACSPSEALGRWPAGKEGWTIVVATRRSERAARDVAQRLAAKGVPDLGILHSNDFPSLEPGFWVVYSGEFDTQAQAAQALDASDLPDVYIRRIAAN